MFRKLQNWTWVMILAALALSSACVPAAEQPTALPPQTPAGQTDEPLPSDELVLLPAGEWILAGYGPQDSPAAPLAGSSVTIRFEGGQLSGSAGCNSYFGSYQLDRGALTIGPVGNTEMWCEGLMDQETAFLRLLQAAESVGLTEEQLTIRAGQEVLLFQRPEPVMENPLEGIVWQLDSIRTADTVQSVLAGTRITLELDGERASGSAGCNHYGTSYTLDGNALRFGLMQITVMACQEEGVMEQETAYLAALEATESCALESDALILVAGEHELIFKAADHLPLEGTHWILGGIAKGEAIIQTWIDVEITAEFAEGQVAGSAGCNSYSASYQLEGNSLSLGPVASTRMACEEERMQRESEFLSALGAAAGYSIKLDTLTLTDPAGNTLLTFQSEGALGQ